MSLTGQGRWRTQGPPLKMTEERMGLGRVRHRLPIATLAAVFQHGASLASWSLSPLRGLIRKRHFFLTQALCATGVTDVKRYVFMGGEGAITGVGFPTVEHMLQPKSFGCDAARKLPTIAREGRGRQYRALHLVRHGC